MVTTTEIMSIDDSLDYIKAKGRDIYPVTKDSRKNIGNLPPKLHEELAAFAAEHQIHIYEGLAALWDFHKEYEHEFEKELKKQRALPPVRRKI